MFKKDFRLRKVKPLTENQSRFFRSFDDGRNIVAHGFSGVGKSFLSLYKSYEQILSGNSNYDKVVLIRSAVPSRDIGFLPGGLSEKLQSYELPYIDICDYLFDDEVYEDLKKQGLFEFISTSYLRGLTFVNSIVIIEEQQNCQISELDTIITRIGKNCRIIFNGDEEQTDLPPRERQKRIEFYQILANTGEFDFIEFGEQDIVRSGLVKKYIIEKNKFYKGLSNNEK